QCGAQVGGGEGPVAHQHPHVDERGGGAQFPPHQQGGQCQQCGHQPPVRSVRQGQQEQHQHADESGEHPGAHHVQFPPQRFAGGGGRASAVVGQHRQDQGSDAGGQWHVHGEDGAPPPQVHQEAAHHGADGDHDLPADGQHAQGGGGKGDAAPVGFGAQQGQPGRVGRAGADAEQDAEGDQPPEGGGQAGGDRGDGGEGQGGEEDAAGSEQVCQPPGGGGTDRGRQVQHRDQPGGGRSAVEVLA